VNILDPWRGTSPDRSPLARGFPVLLAALAFFVALWANSDLGRRPLTGDELDYHRIAVDLAANGRFGTAYRFPVYPLIMAGFYRTFGANPAVMRVPNAMLAALTVWLTWLMAERVGRGRRWALVPVLLLGADAHLFRFAGMLLSENVFTPMVTAIALLLTRRGQNVGRASTGRLKGAGVLLGVSVLTRGQGLFILAACIAAEVLRRRRLSSWVVTAAGTAAVGLALWNVAIRREQGRWPILTSGTGWVLYGSYCPEAYQRGDRMGRWVPPSECLSRKRVPQGKDEWEENKVLARAALRSMLAHSLEQNIRLLVNKVFSALYPSPGVPAGAPLFIKGPAVLLAWSVMFGFLAGLWLRPHLVRERFPFYAATLVAVMLFYGSKRIMFPVFPLICLDAVNGWTALFERFRRSGPTEDSSNG